MRKRIADFEIPVMERKVHVCRDFVESIHQCRGLSAFVASRFVGDVGRDIEEDCFPVVSKSLRKAVFFSVADSVGVVAYRESPVCQISFAEYIGGFAPFNDFAIFAEPMARCVCRAVGDDVPVVFKCEELCLCERCCGKTELLRDFASVEFCRNGGVVVVNRECRCDGI